MKTPPPTTPAPPAPVAPDLSAQMFPLVKDTLPFGASLHIDLLEITSALTLIANTDMRRHGHHIEAALSLVIKALEVITDRMEDSAQAGGAQDPND